MDHLNIEVSPRGIAALRGLNADLETLTGQLYQEADLLLETYTENRDGLGCHANEIRQLLKELYEDVEDAAVLIKKLQKKLTRAVAIRENLVYESHYRHSR